MMSESPLKCMRDAARELCGRLQRTGNVGSLLPKVVNLMASPDIAVKKLCYNTYGRQAHKAPKEAVLAVNCILKDSKSSSPIVRALVLRTLMLLDSDLMPDIKQKIIAEGLKDGSSLVRRHAVTACNHFSSDNDGPIEKSDVLVFDKDPIVAMYALTEMSDPDQSTMFKFLNNISQMTEEGLCQIMEKLCLYKPANQQQGLDIMSILDPYLDSENIAVVTTTMEVFKIYSKFVDSQIRADVWRRLQECCKRFLQSQDVSLVYFILIWMKENMDALDSETDRMKVLSPNYHLFLSKSTDPDHVKLLKLDFITQFVNSENIDIVLENLQLCIQSGNEVTCDSVSNVLLKLKTDYPEHCGDTIVNIYSSQYSKALRGMLPHALQFKNDLEPYFEAVLFNIIDQWKELHEKALLTLLYLISRHGYQQARSRSVVANVMQSVFSSSSSYSTRVRLAALAAVFQCFLHEPDEYKEILRNCIVWTENCDSQVLIEQGRWISSQICAGLAVQ